MYARLQSALESYSQPFIQGERQLDPDKLSKVMFLCGLAQNLTNNMENAVALTMLQIDNIMEDDVTIPDEDEKT